MKSDIHSAGAVTAALIECHEIPREELLAPVRVPRSNPTRIQHTNPSVESHQDDRILAQVRQALHHCGYEQLRRLKARCRHGHVVLQGSISTYYLKQVAQEIVTNLTDVRGIDNDLRVIRAG